MNENTRMSDGSIPKVLQTQQSRHRNVLKLNLWGCCLESSHPIAADSAPAFMHKCHKLNQYMNLISHQLTRQDLRQSISHRIHTNINYGGGLV